LLLSKDIHTDRLEVGKVKTTSDKATIQIQNGLIEVFGSNSDSQPNIKFGVDDVGRSILEFYDENGTLLYDLGPTYGLRNRSTTIYKS